MSQPVAPSEQPAYVFSIVTESFNVLEGMEVESLRRSLRAATACVESAAEPGEVLLVDVAGGPEIESLLKDFPDVRQVSCPGLDYDAAKNRGARHARGEYLIFLDGDCAPADGWMEALLRPLRNGESIATCGFTAYAGRRWAALQTLLDFGFLLPRSERPVGCYACNNWAVRRAELIAMPIPEEALRCSCYPHAQRLKRRGTPVHLVPDAIVTHDLPPFWKERTRRGWDLVAVCWADPALPEARLLERGLRALPAFYWKNVKLDQRRLRDHYDDLGLTRRFAAVARLVVPLLRLPDVFGLARALWHDRTRRRSG